LKIHQPYHLGELAVQRRANEADIARINGTVIDSNIPAGALHFIARQPMTIMGSIDPDGRLWASALFGPPGCVYALDRRNLEIDTSQLVSIVDDPLWHNLEQTANVGVLLVELESRRRLRLNGAAKKVGDYRYRVSVEWAYPNCPKYIQRRQLTLGGFEASDQKIVSTQGIKLTETQKGLITNADTFFVASSNPNHGVDASHRGGNPGFVQFINNTTLRIPDYVGNSMFNTLGNINSYPYAGLLFIDFDAGRLLQLTGCAEIFWDADDPQELTGGTYRFWQFEIHEWREHTLPYHMSWTFIDYSPYNPEHVFEQISVNSSKNFTLRVESVQCEADNIKSFRLCAMDDDSLPPFEAGSHIQVKVLLPDHTTGYRNYSLLSDPNDRSIYEIAVLAESEGRGGSLYLHQHIHKGDTLEVRLAKNEFPMVVSAEHTILIAGGIGITPIMAMLQKLVSEQQSFELHYSARKLSEFAFRDQIKRIAADQTYFYASREQGGRRLNLKSLLSAPGPGVHVYVCGPRRMIASVQEVARAMGWPDVQIHFESFGERAHAGDQTIEVHLTKSDRVISVPAGQTILDMLLDAGIQVPHQCKRGECSMCSTRVLAGEPDHRDLCLNAEERSESMCICVSRAQGKLLKLDL